MQMWIHFFFQEDACLLDKGASIEQNLPAGTTKLRPQNRGADTGQENSADLVGITRIG